MLILTKTSGESLKKAKAMSPEEVIAKVKEAGLKGRGGAGFPTGLKWEITTKAKGDKYLICNADEGEPGTFKDKLIIEKNPELLIEGILIAIYALSAKKAYIYLRQEYFYLREYLEKAINHFKSKDKIEIVLGAGAYICGDETAIMNSIEGKRGEPRNKPPYPAQKGLWQQPTCINNVETLAMVPLIFTKKWDKDLMLFSVSGDVENPGVYEAKEGAILGELMKKASPAEPKAVFFGASGGCLPYKESLVLSNENLRKQGVMLGCGTLIIVRKHKSIPKLCENVTEFFVAEGCGMCTPCREGNYRLLQLFEVIEQKKWDKKDLGLAVELAEHISETSFCALGKSSTAHLLTALKHFEKEFAD